MLLRRALPALGAFVAVRLLGLLTLVVWAHLEGTGAHERLVRWDAQWYAGIAAHGYGLTRIHEDGRHLSDLAFFPLFPGLERAVGQLTGLPYVDAGLVVSAVASLAAAVALFAIGERLYDGRAALFLVVLWAALPIGIVESMAYSESLFTALAAWSLHHLLARRWWAAGALAVLAGLTRPVGVAVVAAVAAAVLAGAVLGHRSDDSRWAWPAAAVAPLGWLGYVGWVGYRVGTPAGYFDVAGRWGNGFDGGASFATWTADLLVRRPVLGALVVVAVAALVALLVLAVRDGQPLPLVVFAAVLVAVALTSSGYFGSKPRYLLPAFPLLLPLAVRLARLPGRVAASGLVTPPLGSAAYGAFWLLGPGPP